MTLGFGFGLPHYTYKFGGAGTSYFFTFARPINIPANTPPNTSTTTAATPNLLSYSVVVDPTGKSTVFGYDSAATIRTGFGINFGVTGGVSGGSYEYFNTTYRSPSFGILNPSGGFYTLDGTPGCICPCFPCNYCQVPNVRRVTTNLTTVQASISSGGVSGVCTCYAYFPLVAPIIDNTGNVLVLSSPQYGNVPYAITKYTSNLSTLLGAYVPVDNSGGFPNYAYQPFIYAFATQPVSGNIIIVGVSASTTVGTQPNAFVQSININTGTVNWAYIHTYTSTYSHLRAVATDTSDNIYAIGSDGGTVDQFAVFKFNSSGVKQWDRLVTGTWGYAIAVDAAGDVYVVGNNPIGVSINNVSLCIVKISGANGSVQWARQFSCCASNGSTNGNSAYINVAPNSIASNVAVQGTAIYVPVQIYNSNATPSPLTYVGMLKVPIDGTHTTGSPFSLAGLSFNYINAGSVIDAGALNHTYTSSSVYSIGSYTFTAGTTTVTPVPNPSSGGTQVL